VNDNFLGVRISGFVTYSGSCPVTGKVWFSTGCAVAKPVVPCEPYLVVAVVVAFKIVNNKVLYGGKVQRSPSQEEGLAASLTSLTFQ